MQKQAEFYELWIRQISPKKKKERKENRQQIPTVEKTWHKNNIQHLDFRIKRDTHW